MRSRAIWQAVASEAGFECRPCGSLHLAYADDELAVLREFAASHPEAAEVVSPEEALAKRPSIRAAGLRGALWSGTELCVDPRTAVAAVAAQLGRMGVEVRFGTEVVRIEPDRVETSGGPVTADHVFVCTGPDLAVRMPEVAQAAGLRRCRLHMMRMRPKNAWPPGPHLAAGLTLLHYANFAECPSLPALRERMEREWPNQIENGVHVMVSQHADGTLTVGDSHHDGESPTPYRSEAVDRAILEYLDTFVPVEDLEVLERWEGVYNRSQKMPFLTVTPCPGLHVANVFGTGMTLSFGVAERHVAEVLG